MIWLNIEISEKDEVKKVSPSLRLKDLIVCEYKYKVMPHFIMYPELTMAQLIAQKQINISDLIERVKSWDKKSPILPQHELSMTDDLTDNDIVIR
mmetsp:Transcript_5651/g.7564  ORF Transcript_5651/g.7564 Transcript_5651/m.7564 type:complete len:95 (-) Transcript_5651:1531-1815(-)|eukprot:CAMPEP_0170473072 /NCGR_PEP_ID=MMETSP0123-20130129/15028_1 /TAXON_ID=182087 /ORGANISM="Favella ehrenbergii, Strain Fehren 1" /LENGTH=94 /DNA_ID=CAMNT_0010741827 /DNA_START=257 /DNA_END=541 /DNA_ORIENTATION=-